MYQLKYLLPAGLELGSDIVSWLFICCRRAPFICPSHAVRFGFIAAPVQV